MKNLWNYLVASHTSFKILKIIVLDIIQQFLETKNNKNTNDDDIHINFRRFNKIELIKFL